MFPVLFSFSHGVSRRFFFSGLSTWQYIKMLFWKNLKPDLVCSLLLFSLFFRKIYFIAQYRGTSYVRHLFFSISIYKLQEISNINMQYQIKAFDSFVKKTTENGHSFCTIVRISVSRNTRRVPSVVVREPCPLATFYLTIFPFDRALSQIWTPMAWGKNTKRQILKGASAE